jgi:hypothetical protein
MDSHEKFCMLKLFFVLVYVTKLPEEGIVAWDKPVRDEIIERVKYICPTAFET